MGTYKNVCVADDMIKNFKAKCAYCNNEVKFKSIRQLLSYGWLSVMNMKAKRGFVCYRKSCLEKDGRTEKFISEQTLKRRHEKIDG